MLLAARESKADRVVYTSSTSIYGNPRSIPINEDDVLGPAVAVRGEQARRRALLPRRSTRATACRRACVRYSNVYGPGQRPDNPYCGVVAKFMSDVHAGRPVSVHGDGEQTRDYTYIDDAVDATLLAAIHPRAEGEVFNVGTGIETSVNALASGHRPCARRARSTSSTSTVVTSTTSGGAS